MMRKLCGTFAVVALVIGLGAVGPKALALRTASVGGRARARTPSAGSGAPGSESPGSLTINSLLDIRFPSGPAWSPDGKTIAFLWDRAGVQNIFTVAAAGGAPVALTHDDSGLIGSLFWSHDGRTIYFTRQGGLWQVPAAGGAPAPVWKTNDTGGGFALSPDGSRVAFSRGGDLYVRRLDAEAETRLTTMPTAETGPIWSPDGAHIAFTIRNATRHEDAPAFSGAKILFTWFQSADPTLAVVGSNGGPVVPLAPGAGNAGAASWIDAGHVVFQRVTDDVHTREIVVADATSGAGRVVHRDMDPKWWDMLFLDAQPQPSPDGRWIAFLSDADGWAQLYVMPAAGGTPVQITRGRFEVDRASWSPDSRRIVFDVNTEAEPGRRELMVADLGANPAAAHLETITTGIGTNTDAHWAPAGNDLVFEHTDPRNAADLYAVQPSVGTTPIRLTDSLPATVSRDALVAPQFVHYPSADGTPVPAYLFVPHGLDRSQRHPAIIWVHGDGINQNYEGWHIHRDYGVYYSFHQYLVQHGYVVLSVDYRGSIGYGRAWREAVY
ncbi:MAG TPA: DPP IV N-terminal domain-containing protein, partial [Vicinamibacterales bacterium]|nr:DPP IV N-terminal domain-containing protein [Vicinamibacterales bacterium]